MIAFKKYENSHLEEVLLLLQPLWGHMSLETRRAYFNWKYLKNPLCPISNAFVATDKGKVIAFRGYFFQKYKSNLKEVLVAAISDAVVHPDYQGKGVFKELTLYSMEQLSSTSLLYMTVSNDTWRTSKTYLKLGSQPLNDKNILYHFSAFTKGNNLDVTIKKGSEFNYEIFNQIKAHVFSKISIKDDGAFWRWRYANPCTKYEYLFLYKNGSPVGFISYFRISKFRAYILDSKLECVSYLKDALFYLKKEEGLYLTQMWSISKSREEKKELKDIGFKSFKRLLKLIKRESLPPVLIRPGKLKIVDEAWEFEGLDIRDESNWHLNLICSDGV